MSRERWLVVGAVLPYLVAVLLALAFAPALHMSRTLDGPSDTHAAAAKSAASLWFTGSCSDGLKQADPAAVALCAHGVWLVLSDVAPPNATGVMDAPFLVLKGGLTEVLWLSLSYGLLAVVFPVGLLLGSVGAAWGMLRLGTEPQRRWLRQQVWWVSAALGLVVLSGVSQSMSPGSVVMPVMVAAITALLGAPVLYQVAPRVSLAGVGVLAVSWFVCLAVGLYALAHWGVCWWSGLLLVLALWLCVGAGLWAWWGTPSGSSLWPLLFLAVCLLRDFLSFNLGLVDVWASSYPMLLGLLAPGYFFVYAAVLIFWQRFTPVLSLYPNLFRMVWHQFLSLRDSAKSQWVQSNVSYLEKLHRKEREAILAERSAIYRELHDGVSSQLVTLLYSVKRGGANPAALETGLSRCLNQIRAILMGAAMDRGKSVQDVFFEYCFGLDDLFGDGHLVFEYQIGEGDYCFFDNSAHDLLKIFQEAVANALKHSGARRLHLSLVFGDADLTVTFTESNFSRGVALRHVSSSGVGLLSQQQRAHKLGGEFVCRHLGDLRITEVRVPLLQP